jgi:L-fuconolactonase
LEGVLRIDAHQHFWHYDANDYAWISESMTILRDDFLPKHLEILLKQKGMEGCVAVQARQSLEETRWLMLLAAKHPMILGVVGWIDICDDNLTSQLAEFKSNTYLKGFRHVLQDEADANFMLHPLFIRGLKVLAQYGYSYDILVHADQLPQVCQLVRQLPVMNLVIDHIAKPNIAIKQWHGWQEYIKELASFSHVHCKVSGMVTEADWQHWSVEDIRPYWQHVYQCFGSERLMFGSDWPVCQLAASYETVHDLLEEFINESDPQIKNHIMGETAAYFYRLAAPKQIKGIEK